MSKYIFLGLTLKHLGIISSTLFLKVIVYTSLKTAIWFADNGDCNVETMHRQGRGWYERQVRVRTGVGPPVLQTYALFQHPHEQRTARSGWYLILKESTTQQHTSQTGSDVGVQLAS
jgi:hypothetical protein